jgi:hypothetical protein
MQAHADMSPQSDEGPLIERKAPPGRTSKDGVRVPCMLPAMSSSLPSYPELTRDISARVARLRADAPAAMQGFRALSQGAMEAGVLGA